MDDLLTADEFADRPRDGSVHNAHVYAEYHRLAAEQAALRRVVVFGRLRRRLRALALVDDLSPSQAAVLTRLHREGHQCSHAPQRRLLGGQPVIFGVHVRVVAGPLARPVSKFVGG